MAGALADKGVLLAAQIPTSLPALATVGVTLNTPKVPAVARLWRVVV